MDHYRIDRPDGCESWYLMKDGVCLASQPILIIREMARRMGLRVIVKADWPEIPVLEPITRELAPAPDLGDLDMGEREE